MNAVFNGYRNFGAIHSLTRTWSMVANCGLTAGDWWRSLFLWCYRTANSPPQFQLSWASGGSPNFDLCWSDHLSDVHIFLCAAEFPKLLCPISLLLFQAKDYTYQMVRADVANWLRLNKVRHNLNWIGFWIRVTRYCRFLIRDFDFNVYVNKNFVLPNGAQIVEFSAFSDPNMTWEMYCDEIEHREWGDHLEIVGMAFGFEIWYSRRFFTYESWFVRNIAFLQLLHSNTNAKFESGFHPPSSMTLSGFPVQRKRYLIDLSLFVTKKSLLRIDLLQMNSFSLPTDLI